jgi:hypothetical protein
LLEARQFYRDAMGGTVGDAVEQVGLLEEKRRMGVFPHGYTQAIRAAARDRAANRASTALLLLCAFFLGGLAHARFAARASDGHTVNLAAPETERSPLNVLAPLLNNELLNNELLNNELLNNELLNNNCSTTTAQQRTAQQSTAQQPATTPRCSSSPATLPAPAPSPSPRSGLPDPAGRGRAAR